MFKSFKHLSLLAFTSLVMILLICCLFDYNVETDVGPVPSYCQLASNWCGAASSQMLISFCCDVKANPSITPAWYGTKTLTERQQYIQDWLNTYHSDHSLGFPNKHPDAVKSAIMALKEGGPGNYVVFHNADSSKVMHDMCYWMKTAGYPSATIVNGCHWVVVYRFETDPEPTMTNTIELKNIGIINPSPFCSGGTVAAGSGHTTPDINAETGGWDAYWPPGGVSCWVGEKYHGEYVAVVEPPEATGKAKFKKAYVGKKEEILPVESVLKKARGYVEQRKLTKYKVLNFLTEAWPETAFLVEWRNRDRYYYLVPFVSKKGGPADAVMIINAYNGDYHECGALHSSVEFIPKEKAVETTLIKMDVKQYKRIDASLLYVDCDISQSHYFPFWEINVDGKLFYVDQNADVFQNLFLSGEPIIRQ